MLAASMSRSISRVIKVVIFTHIIYGTYSNAPAVFSDGALSVVITASILTQ